MDGNLHSRGLGWVGVLIALGAPAIFVATMHGKGGNAISLERELSWWALGAVVLGWAVRVEHLAPRLLAIRRPSLGSFGWGLAGGLLMILVTGLCYGILFPALGLGRVSPSQLALIAARPVWIVALLALRAAVVEEWLFRFYPISRLHTLTGSAVTATLLPAAVFIGLHASGWGIVHLLPVALMTVIITVLYWWRRDYACNAVAHFLADFIPFAWASLQLSH